MSLAPSSLRFAATTGGRFSWRIFSADEQAEAVVYDRQTGNTHRLHRAAQTIQQHLQEHPQGLTLDEIFRELWDGEVPGDEKESTELASACAALLSQMEGMGMVHRMSTTCT